MFKSWKNKNNVLLWQIVFMLFGTSWLLAPALNQNLSSRTTLISQYETSFQPYAWIFRSGDIIAAVLLLLAVFYVKRKSNGTHRYVYIVLIIIGIMMFLDPTITTTCQPVGRLCIETPGLKYYIHGAESILLAISILSISAYDSIKRKVLVSTLFLLFQLSYGLFNLSKLADTYRVATLSQFIYQFVSTLWLAWFVASLLPDAANVSAKFKKYARQLFAGWAYVNGSLAIVLSLMHLHLVGILNSVYFANDTAWLAQHGVLVGVTMIYISWRLWRGEHRARQLFLILLFTEIIKYSVISPQPLLVGLYAVTFVTLFSMSPYFRRGSISLSWHLRIQEVGIVLAGVITTLSIAFILVARNIRHLEIAKDALEKFTGFVIYYEHVPRHLLKSSLLAHTLSVLIFATIFFVLFSLFRPTKQLQSMITNEEIDDAKRLLVRHSVSSEDYFKLWPKDKNYYWSADKQTVIAYKITKSVVFALADPIGPTLTDRKLLLKDFISHWSVRGYRLCFLLISEYSKSLYAEAGMNILQIGSSAIVGIDDFANSIVKNKWWRWQSNRAVKAGYRYKYSLAPHDASLLTEIKSVSDAWLERSGRREQGFALGNYDISYMQSCTLHYLVDNSSQVIAFGNEIPIFNSQRQTTIDLMRFRPDANNAMPYLLANIIIKLSGEGNYDTFDLGFVPLANMKGKIAKVAKLIAAPRFSIAGLEQFKNKFDPHWSKSYVAYDGDITELAIIALNLEEVMNAS